MRERLVVDASVAAKWILRDEQDVERADAVKRRYDCGQIDLLAPGQIRVEVANAIRRAALRAHSPIGRADAAEALRAWL
ncbi:MAG: type II toxin-antitoxin system VapC family toxin, partial [Anaerolineae bacterium]